MHIALLRIIIPIIIFLVVLRIVWPRYQRFKQQREQMIEVDAEVVGSEQHTSTQTSDIPKSPIVTQPQDETKTDK